MDILRLDFIMEYIMSRAGKIFLCAAFLFSFTLISQAKLKITNPLPSQKLIIDTPLRIEWENPDSLPVSIYYSFNSGNTWNKITEGITGTYYDWRLPISDSIYIQFKVEVNNIIQPQLISEILNAHDGEIRSASISRDGKYILSGSEDTKIKVWDIDSGKALDSVSFDKSQVYSASFYNNDTVIATVDNSVVLWDRKSGKVTTGSGLFNNIVRHCSVLPGKGLTGAVSYDATAKIFNINDIVTPLENISVPDSDAFYCSRFSHDGNTFAFAGYNGKIYIYNIPQKKITNILFDSNKTKAQLIWSVDFSGDDKYLTSGGVDGKLRIWDLTTMKLKDSSTIHQFHIRSVNYKPGTNIILTGALDNIAKQTDAGNLNEVCNPINHKGQILSDGYSPTGDTIITAGRDNAIRLWKNYFYVNDRDSLSCTLHYPAKLYIPDIIAEANAIVNIPCIFKDDYKYSRDHKILLFARFISPNKMLDILSGAPNFKKGIEYDSISYSRPGNIPDFLLNDTLLVLKGLTLQSEKTQDTLNFVDKSWDFLYKVDVKPGILTIVNKCAADGQRNVVFSPAPMDINIEKNPADDIIPVSVNLVEDGEHKIEIFNGSGNVSKLIYINLRHGSYNFELNARELPSGAYYIRLSSQNSIVSKPIIIIH